MKYWIASSNRENWEIVRTKHVWGVPRRNKNIVSRVHPGDAILIYVSQEKVNDELLPSAVTGAYEVISEGYEDHSRIFNTPPHMGNEDFPYRVDLKPIKVFSTPVEFKPLIPDLKFITNKTMWSGHLRIAMREIPAEDYQLILKRAGQGA